MKPTPLALTFALLACTSGVEPMARQKDGPAPSMDAARTMAAANNAFGLDLYREIRSTEGNLLFSPHSIAIALGMVRAGAAGETSAQMNSVLHVGDDPRTASAYRDLDLLLEPGDARVHDGRRSRDVPAFELASAHRIWVDDGLDLHLPFREHLETVFGAPLETVDFSRSGSVRKKINDWVARQTRSRIQDIVPEGQPSADALLALANAIYFKARWRETFGKSGTADAPFHRASGDPVPVSMMRQQHSFPYAETDDLQVLELPYSGNETSMIILLPRSLDGLEDLEETLEVILDEGRLTSLVDSLGGRQVSVRLPRFGFDASFELSAALRALGMPDAFSLNAADFSGISKDQQLALDAVLHKAFIAVDEDGTEAAAATTVVAVGSAIDPEEPVPFTADHPFLFLIRHRSTGAILFMGRVADPS